jgi:hypothetical protein
MNERNSLHDDVAREAFRTQIDSTSWWKQALVPVKTTLLVDRLTALICQIPTPQHRCYTFTEKAARELADRARSRIEREVLSSSQTSPTLLKALQNLDAASLTTIHSFAASLIREKALDAGLDPEFTHCSPSMKAGCFRKRSRGFNRTDAETQGNLELFLALGGRIADLIALVEALYQRRDLRLDDSND